MTAADHPPVRANQLRKLAERRVVRSPIDVSVTSVKEIERLVYELQVHQEELDIQNEELRRAQLELQSSRDRYADLYDFAPVGYLTLDAKGHILEANLTAVTILGVERSRLIRTRLALYCDTTSRNDLLAHLDQVLSSKSHHSRELLFHAGDGSERYLRLDSQSAAEPAAAPQVRMVLTDIGDRKKAELDLLEKDRHLQSLADALPVLIGYLDTDLRFRFCNAAHSDWLGQPAESLIGQRFQDVLGGDLAEEVEDYFADAISGRRVDLESQMTHHTRGTRHVQMMLVPDEDPDRELRGLHCLCIDITERKTVEEQNARRRGFAERLNRLNSNERHVYDLIIRGEANKTIAHELDIGLRTAERRRQIIFNKLEVGSVAELLQQLSDIQGVGPV